MVIAGWHDIENFVVSDVYVKRFKSKGVGIKTLEAARVFPCADGSLQQEGHAQRQTSRHQRVERFDGRRAYSSLGEARGDLSQSARVTLSKQKKELQTF